MQPVTEEQPTCLKPAGKSIVDLLGKSYVLELLYFLFNHDKSVRFNELKHKLSITATTLSRRLEEFVKFGFVTREVFAEVPARVEYSLSKKGESLGPVLRHLFEWVENNNS
jgi:DNA-binding HxlR family transcriptional regulator